MCHAHLNDGSFSDGKIKCNICKHSKCFEIKNFLVKENEALKSLLETNDHLSYPQKKVKSLICDKIVKYNNLHQEFQPQLTAIEVICFDYFHEIKCLVYLETETRNYEGKTEDFQSRGISMIDQVKNTEKKYASKFKNLLGFYKPLEFEYDEEIEKLNEALRDLDLDMEKLLEEFTERLQHFRALVKDFKFFLNKMKSCTFIKTPSFGNLVLNDPNRYLLSW